MSRIRKPSVFAPSPTSYVQEALGTVGVESRTVGCWSHALQNWVLSHVLPVSLRNILLWYFQMKRRSIYLAQHAKKE